MVKMGVGDNNMGDVFGKDSAHLQLSKQVRRGLITWLCEGRICKCRIITGINDYRCVSKRDMHTLTRKALRPMQRFYVLRDLPITLGYFQHLPQIKLNIAHIDDGNSCSTNGNAARSIIHDKL